MLEGGLGWRVGGRLRGGWAGRRWPGWEAGRWLAGRCRPGWQADDMRLAGRCKVMAGDR